MSRDGKLRVRRRLGSAKLTSEQIRSCYRLYANGMSLYQIGELIWEKYGYSNARSAEICIRKAFYKDGYALRSRREAGRLRAQRFYGTKEISRDENGKTLPDYGKRYWKRTRKLQPRCTALTRAGRECSRASLADSEHCYAHDPRFVQERSEVGYRHQANLRQQRCLSG